MGGRAAVTPHLDALAARSLVLEQHHVQSTWCTPSRASLYTGRRYEQYTINPHDGNYRAYSNATTMGQFFLERGYMSAMFGKGQWGINLGSFQTDKDKLDLELCNDPRLDEKRVRH